MITNRKVIDRETIIAAVRMVATRKYSVRHAATMHNMSHPYLLGVLAGKNRRGLYPEVKRIMDSRGFLHQVPCPHCHGEGVIYESRE